MPTLIPISVPSEPIEHASLALAGALAGDLPIETSLTLAEALAVLTDVTPPYPPLPPEVGAASLDEAVTLARRCLSQAVDAASSAEERLRCAQVLGLLSGLGGPQP